MSVNSSQYRFSATISERDLRRRIIETQLPHLGFVPHGSQEEAIKAIGSGVFILLVTAGNGWGKTFLGANIVANIVHPIKSSYFKGHNIFTKWEFPKLGRIVSSPDNLSDGGAVTEALEFWLPKNYYTKNKGGKNIYNQYLFDSGHKIKVLTVEQDLKEYESDTLGWAWFDEPSTYAQYTATIARMRKGGFIFITATPLFGSAWMKDEIADKTDGRDQIWIQGDIEDNCIEHGVRGTLKHEHIERMVRKYDPEEKEARKSGKFMYLSGLIYKIFNKDIHVISPGDIDSLFPESIYGAFNDFPSVNLVDPHDRRSDCHMWAKITPTNDLVIYDEYPDFNYAQEKYRKHSVKDVAKIIKLKEHGQTEKMIKVLLSGKQTIVRRIMDKRKGNTMQGTQNRITFDLYRDAGREIAYELNYEESPTVGLQMIDHKSVKEYLGWDQSKPITPQNRPKLFVLADCQNTIWDFTHYVWDEYRGKTKDHYDLKEKPQDKNKDYMDCVRWLCELKLKYSSYQHLIKTSRPYNNRGYYAAKQRNINTAFAEDSWML